MYHKTCHVIYIWVMSKTLQVNLSKHIVSTSLTPDTQWFCRIHVPGVKRCMSPCGFFSSCRTTCSLPSTRQQMQCCLHHNTSMHAQVDHEEGPHLLKSLALWITTGGEQVGHYINNRLCLVARCRLYDSGCGTMLGELHISHVHSWHLLVKLEQSSLIPK